MECLACAQCVDACDEVRFSLGAVEEATSPRCLDSPVPAQVVMPQAEVRLGALEGFRVPLFITVQRGRVTLPFNFTVEVADSASGEVKRMEARSLGATDTGG